MNTKHPAAAAAAADKKSDPEPAVVETRNTASQPPHPGAVLKELIKGIDFEILCVNLATSPKELSLFLEGSVPLTARLALRLSRTIEGRNFYAWMKLQNDYDLHFEEDQLKFVTSGHIFNLAHLFPAEARNSHGTLKLEENFRRYMTHSLVAEIEKNVNDQRKLDGLSPWKDRDFEKAFSIGTENDSHAGRQWRRLRDKSSKGGTTEDRLRMIKKMAEKNGWLSSTEVEITPKMIREFLEILDLRFLNNLRWNICSAIGEFSSALRGSTAHHLDLAELDVYLLDPDELVLNEDSSKDEIQDFILEKLDELSEHLSWMTTKLRTPHW